MKIPRKQLGAVRLQKNVIRSNKAIRDLVWSLNLRKGVGIHEYFLFLLRGFSLESSFEESQIVFAKKTIIDKVSCRKVNLDPPNLDYSCPP